MKIEPKGLVVHQKIELYALRMILAQSGVASLIDQDKAVDIARKSYSTLLSSIDGDQPEQPDWEEILKGFEGPIQ